MDYREIISQKLAEINLTELENVFNENAADVSKILGNYSVEGIIENLLSGEPIFNTEQMINGVFDIFMYEVKAALMLGTEIVAIAVLIGLLKGLATSFGEKAVSNLGMIISTCFIIGLCLNNFTVTFELCRSTVNIMTKTMQIILPILIPILIASGGISSGGILSPVFAGAITTFTTVMSAAVLPSLYAATVFYMINSMTEKDYVSRLADFIKNAAIFICGLCVTVFSGLVAVQGFLAETADGLLAETTRYSASNFIPIVGGFAADSLDLALYCIRIVKNGIGLFGILALISALIIPIIKLMAVAVMYKLTAVITEPLGNKQVSECLNQMGNSVITMTVILFLTAFMFMMFITVIIGIGG